jgi:hypothetical protein
LSYSSHPELIAIKDLSYDYDQRSIPAIVSGNKIAWRRLNYLAVKFLEM